MEAYTLISPVANDNEVECLELNQTGFVDSDPSFWIKTHSFSFSLCTFGQNGETLFGFTFNQSLWFNSWIWRFNLKSK